MFYIILQFISWEIMFVKKTDEIIELKQRLTELNSSDETQLQKDIEALHHKKKMQIVMIVGEGTVFLLLLLFGIYKLRQSMMRETEFNNRQKNFFLSITHELKTPIAATKLQLQTLQKHQLDEKTKNELIHHALHENERLNTLINNLLLASRMESGEYKLKIEKTNISILINDTLERYYKTEIEKGELIRDIEADIVLGADATAFPSIVTNLVDNALKYSGDMKKVNLALKKSGKDILLSVSDQGNGISDQEKKKVFDRFYRSGSEETRQAKGTGLGLYIVKFLVKQHRGHIAVKDNHPRGSIFEIEFHAG